MAEDPFGLDSLSDWTTFADRLREEVVKAGSPALRTLEKKAEKEGLSLPRSSLSRTLTERKRPRQQLVSNLLTVLGADDEKREAWAAAWQRLVLAEVNSPGPKTALAEPAPGGSVVIEEAISDALTDLVDTIKVVLASFADEQVKQVDSAMLDKFMEMGKVGAQALADAAREADESDREVKARRSELERLEGETLGKLNAAERNLLRLKESAEIAKRIAKDYWPLPAAQIIGGGFRHEQYGLGEIVETGGDEEKKTALIKFADRNVHIELRWRTALPEDPPPPPF